MTQPTMYPEGLVTDDGMVTLPASAVRELAKWAYSASYYDGQVSMRQLMALPIAGIFVAEISVLNEERERQTYPADFDSI